MVVVEVFCGSGRLTASLKQEGFDAFGIDHVALKHAACSKLDLLCRDSAAHLWRIVADPAVQFIHFAPPCGTASRARDIQFPGAPQALRSEARPEGVDGLVGVNATRVRKANELYKTTLELISFCLENGKYFSCENPMRSYLWLLPEWKRLLLREDVIQTSFHRCEYGGLRRKETRLVHNVPSFKELERRCAGGHVHLGWGKIGKSWATAAETAYPWGLCKSMANLLKQHFVALGCSPPPTNLAGTANPNQAARAFTGIQSRKHVPPLLSEFASVHTVLVPGNLANAFLRPGTKLTSDWRPGTMSQCTPALD